MNRFVKIVSGFFMWLAVLTVSAHLVIPHDHHSSDIFLTQEEKCPSSDHKSDQHSGLPLHCKLFNDLTSERTRLLQITENLQFSFDSLSILKDASCSSMECSFIKLRESANPLFNTSVPRSTSLRAPPAQA